MIFTILIILETICIIPLTVKWYKAQHNKFPEEAAISINTGFVIAASIINWFCFAAYVSGPSISPTSGFFGGDLHIPGLVWAIAPPILVVIIAYILFQIAYHISFEIFMAKQRDKKWEKK
jgi:uncharacterized membrane protein